MYKKVIRYLLMVFALCSGVGAVYADEAFYVGTADLPINDKWMSWLKDDVRIRDISIPGTHDSGSRYGLTAFSRNQTLTIPQQLNAGIRFLDVRARHIDNIFTIHHGEVFQSLMFVDVMRSVAAFLKANPSEFVFVRIKEEHKPENVTRSFEQTFDYYRKIFSGVIWKPTQFNPTLAEVRGRIVFIQDFSSYQLPTVGLPLWTFNVQDDWDFNMFTVTRKSGVITRAIDNALSNKSNVINNLAVSAPIYTPKQTANVFNDETLIYLNQKVLTRPIGDRYVGILPMDYPGAAIIDAIIRTNNVSCSSVYLDAKNRQLATCFGRGLASPTDAKAYAAKCDGTEQRTKDGIACYITNTNTLKPVRLELQPTCSTLASKDGRYLSCDNSFVATHTAPVITCNGFFNVMSGLCTDIASKAVKPLDLSCYGSPVQLPEGAVSYGCRKPEEFTTGGPGGRQVSGVQMQKISAPRLLPRP